MANVPIEVLAPAGGPESLTAAVHSGADAVYFGYGQFNARRNAQNFDQEAFAQAARFCRARGVKMYLTMNTLVYDKERSALLDTLELACQNGIDALIVQDLGVADLVRRAAPQMPLHASTQMTVHNVSGARELWEMGFSRVVLAREMSREEIAAVVQQVPVETEVFVHGALCMCVSGQCYMRSGIGERSGNRGLCAQPCRLPFTSGRGDSGYALSLKDLSLVQRVEELKKLGVTSFKIEGRMKRPEYVSAAVTAFRQALAGQKPDLRSLEAVFSRSGFTQGYFDARLGQQMFGIRQKEDVTAGQKVLRELEALGAKEYSRVPLVFDFTMKAGEPVCLQVSDGDGNTVQVTGAEPQPAQNRPTDEELVRRSLEKTGGTFYRAADCRCQLEEGLAFPVSQINALRREALEQLTARREAERPVPFARVEPQPARRRCDGPPALRAQVRRWEQITPALAQRCELIAVPLEELLHQEQLPDFAHKLAASLPRVTFGDDAAQLRPKLEELRLRGITHLTTPNIGSVRLGRELGFTLHGEFGLNLTNTDAAFAWKERGLADAVVSFELSLARARGLGGPLPLGVFAYGSQPLMITRNCPIRIKGCGSCRQQGTLTDRKKQVFPVRCTQRQYSEVFNAHPLYLADRWEDFSDFAFALLYFTGESPKQVDQVLYQYETGHEPRQDITRGLYYRNVK